MSTLQTLVHLLSPHLSLRYHPNAANLCPHRVVRSQLEMQTAHVNACQGNTLPLLHVSNPEPGPLKADSSPSSQPFQAGPFAISLIAVSTLSQDHSLFLVCSLSLVQEPNKQFVSVLQESIPQEFTSEVSCTERTPHKHPKTLPLPFMLYSVSF